MHGEEEWLVSESWEITHPGETSKAFLRRRNQDRMGCYQSRIESKEIVSRCKARKRYLKQLVKARGSLSASHALYLQSLRATGSAFVHFSTNETPLHHPPPLPIPPPPSPPLSHGPETTWTSTSSALPPPPPPPASSTWDFWDPFVLPPPSSSEEDWDVETATTTTIATPPPSFEDSMTTTGSESAMVASKDLLEIIKEINEYFMKAAESASHLSSLLEIQLPSTTHPFLLIAKAKEESSYLRLLLLLLLHSPLFHFYM